MAVTGTGTQADPFVVHSYSEFISLSGHAPVDDSSVYIKWFDEPNQVLDCNAYGSEFKWYTFSAYNSYGSAMEKTIYIDLNGCTIKNLLVADGKTMFTGYYDGLNARTHKLVIYNGAIRNVFMGSATSKFATSYVDFHDVSISANFSGLTVCPIGEYDNNARGSFDNCALYIVSSKLLAPLMTEVAITDTDIELYINDQNGQPIFQSTNNRHYMNLTGCRLQGKIGGNGYNGMYYSNAFMVLGALNANNNYAEGIVDFVNCVIDMDFTDASSNCIVYTTDGGVSVNTNIICDSHCWDGYTPPSTWNYMSHSLMRNGAYLNNAGFTVVEVVEG